MSYNTRRTSGSPGGRNVPPTQVNYHHQPAARAAPNTTQSRNTTGYTATPGSAALNTSSQPAYTTTPPVPKAAAAPPTTQPQQAPAPTPAAPAPVTPAPTTPAPALIVKQEPATPTDTPKMDTSENGASKPHWKKRPFVKLSNKVRRQRQNAKLRRILNPKNAVTFLNELRPGGVKFTSREEPGWGYVASVNIEGKVYSGHGISLSKAKVQASEQALKHLMLERLSKTATPDTDQPTNEEVKADGAVEGDVEMKESEGAEDKGDKEPAEKKPKIASKNQAEDLPWGSLAAFALHKLFNEWQSESYSPPNTHSISSSPEKYDQDVSMEEDAYYARRSGPPEFGFGPRRFGPGPFPSRGRAFSSFPGARGGLPPGMTRRPLAPPPAATFLTMNSPPMLNEQPMKKIPEDANQRHPVMLLNQLKPNVIYNETREGQSPGHTFVITVTIDGKDFVGKGKNKKEAKKHAAKEALATLGITYPEEENL